MNDDVQSFDALVHGGVDTVIGSDMVPLSLFCFRTIS